MLDCYGLVFIFSAVIPYVNETASASGATNFIATGVCRQVCINPKHKVKYHPDKLKEKVKNYEFAYAWTNKFIAFVGWPPNLPFAIQLRSYINLLLPF